MQTKYFVAFMAIALFFLSSCKKDDTPTPATVSKSTIATTTTANNLTVTLYADTTKLFTGNNNVYVGIKDQSGNVVTNATVTMRPEMAMTMMSHTCAIDQLQWDATNKYFKGACIFGMPTTADGSWKIKLNVNGENVEMPITVLPFPTNVVSIKMGTDSVNYIVSVVRPSKWVVGLNDLELTVHKVVSMMDMPAVTDLSIELTPEMPSMGHGSPNNVNPSHISNGHYKGKVNFTMTGDWRLHLKLKRGNSVVVDDAYLDIVF